MFVSTAFIFQALLIVGHAERESTETRLLAADDRLYEEAPPAASHEAAVASAVAPHQEPSPAQPDGATDPGSAAAALAASRAESITSPETWRFEPVGHTREPKDIPWCVESRIPWEGRSQYSSVTVLGNLTKPDETMSGALTVLQFDRAEGSPIGPGKPWGRMALLKSWDHTNKHEPALIRQGSTGNGFSVYLLDEYKAAGRPSGFFLLNMVRGTDLRTILRQKLMSLAPIQHIFAQLIFMLKSLHDRNVVHRDLKADNILLTPPDCYEILGKGPTSEWVRLNCRFVLTDYGLACSMQEDATKGKGFYCPKDTSLMGTADYVVPEILDVKRNGWSPAADVYCMGSLMTLMLLGYWPITAEPGVSAGGALVAKGQINKGLQKIVAGIHNGLPKIKGLLDKRAVVLNLQPEGAAENMIMGMLSLDPLARPSADTLWANPFLPEDVKEQVVALNPRALDSESSRGTFPRFSERDLAAGE